MTRQSTKSRVFYNPRRPRISTNKSLKKVLVTLPWLSKTKDSRERQILTTSATTPTSLDTLEETVSSLIEGLTKLPNNLKKKSHKEETHVKTEAGYKAAPQTKHTKLQKITKLTNVITTSLTPNPLHLVLLKLSLWSKSIYKNLEPAIPGSSTRAHPVIFATIKNCFETSEPRTLTL